MTDRNDVCTELTTAWIGTNDLEVREKLINSFHSDIGTMTLRFVHFLLKDLRDMTTT